MFASRKSCLVYVIHDKRFLRMQLKYFNFASTKYKKALIKKAKVIYGRLIVFCSCARIC